MTSRSKFNLSASSVISEPTDTQTTVQKTIPKNPNPAGFIGYIVGFFWTSIRKCCQMNIGNGEREMLNRRVVLLIAPKNVNATKFYDSVWFINHLYRILQSFFDS